MKKIILFLTLFSVFAQGMNEGFFLVIPTEIWNRIFDYYRFENKDCKDIYLVNKNFNEFFSSITLNLAVAYKNVNHTDGIKNTLNKWFSVKIFYTPYDSFEDLLIRLKNITSLDLGNCSINDEALKCITLLTNLKSLFDDLDPFSGRDRSLEYISDVNSLQQLNLNGPKNLNLKHVGKLINIKTLYIRGGMQTIDDEGISYLSHLTKIEDIRLPSNTISDYGLKYLSIFTNIIKLNLDENSNITDEGLKHLSLLMSLKDLSLLFCEAISGKEFRYLKSMTSISLNNNEAIKNCSTLINLKKLFITFADEFSNEELRYLSNFTNLEHLKLCGCDKITDDSLQYLGKNLKELNLTGCKQVSEEGIKKHISNLRGLKLKYRRFIDQNYMCFSMPEEK